MHPLLKRLLVRGPFVFAATAGVGLLLGYAVERLLSNDQVQIQRGDDWSGPLTFGAIGLVVYAVLEWLAYARERWKKGPTA